ncbi:MAG: hypothetical protein EHM49_04130 [Deltaproteobacteria bacterium]|nr:MAG: hypothetical protein EHM49_04130 [Deltaproteobacteria bacterium]
MKVITRTSEYELTKDGEDFVLIKTALKEGCTSLVAVGRTFRSKDAYTAYGVLMVGNMNTSPIENLEEVERFLKS